MTTYCQHAHRLRLVRPGGEIESERPRQKRASREAPAGAYLDGPGGTQVSIPDDVVGFDLDFALSIGTIVALPCAEHPRQPPKSPPSKPIGEVRSSG